MLICTMKIQGGNRVHTFPTLIWSHNPFSLERLAKLVFFLNRNSLEPCWSSKVAASLEVIDTQI